MSESNAATLFSVALIGELIGRGMRDIVLCPGARSQALALAAAAWEHDGRVRLRVRIDERVAGFLALGIAVETGLPVAIITTSGTAVANLHPAVLEAHHSGVPLLLLTADRPAELRGIGANQTTDQLGIFGSSVGWVRDVPPPVDVSGAESLAREAFAAASGTPGPVQLNLAFREPLSGTIEALPPLPVYDITAGSALPPRQIEHAPHTVVIAGHDAGPDAEAFARSLGVPLLAEVSSGSHYGPNLVVAYRRLLDDPEFGGLIERAVVFGHPTLSRQIPAMLSRSNVVVHVVRGVTAHAYNPGHRAATIDESVVHDGESDESPAARAWLGSWVHASRGMLALELAPASNVPERAGDFAREQLAVFREPVTRRMLVEAVWRVTWPHDRLVLGASRLIREADTYVSGKRIRVHANRGLAGIDGTIATATGIALSSQDAEGGGASGITRVLVGDLTALYDVGALLFGRGEVRPRIQVVVGNDGGGTIFDGLDVAATAPAVFFDRVQYTPQSVDLRALAAAYGWEYRVARNRGELDEALAASEAPTLVEVVLPR
ncbi:2-succinyl-5-enolpyruvyl-6-hydroxy-3-cyclohexene-1-carboxylic-acid synthase [Frigoribacterium sp. CG_9.8]|uniref:2-succinyl-5-enolpyruvyl-6-hydroxy-3- cyclohexene-1-carboxylic-acid synthase n=1 Tax=Frigoribacterium sp. CG_9.8 TaxID=2787733 RepID=UPI0018CB9045|nr:2-succinyl-5-enolpyruvyl-6-hydroxy-3-cyclohexene-1-carboxylic-acid synthase [Frigoribacterium sp. CG_9.8]MBG6106411.1 2-succinyl-5-enolpyruvyl-6-hydroxy-3-cyclohexene-1-carboxylate synthase [Frigoribacterium sp. CG_9.8]